MANSCNDNDYNDNGIRNEDYDNINNKNNSDNDNDTRMMMNMIIELTSNNKIDNSYNQMCTCLLWGSNPNLPPLTSIAPRRHAVTLCKRIL